MLREHIDDEQKPEVPFGAARGGNPLTRVVEPLEGPAEAFKGVGGRG
jgi:hypothetical protein